MDDHLAKESSLLSTGQYVSIQIFGEKNVSIKKCIQINQEAAEKDYKLILLLYHDIKNKNEKMKSIKIMHINISNFLQKN